VSNFSSFWQLKKRFLPGREIVHWRVTGFMSATAQHFGSLKLWFFKGHESLGSRVCCFNWVTVRHFCVLKNVIFQGSWDPRLYITLLLLGANSKFWWYRRIWRPSAQRYMATFHHFGGLKVRLQPCREILHSRVTGFMSATVPHFGRLKLWFFKVHETLG